MSAKYKHGKYRLSVAGDNKIQNKPILISDDNGNDILDNVGTSYDGLTNQPQVNGVTLKGNKTSAELGLADKTVVVEVDDVDASITPSDNTIYNCGDLDSLDITLPEEYGVDFLAQINFSSGATATQLSDEGDINWQGDDISDGMFAPAASKRYVIILYPDGVDMRGLVSGTTPIPEEVGE